MTLYEKIVCFVIAPLGAFWFVVKMYILIHVPMPRNYFGDDND